MARYIQIIMEHGEPMRVDEIDKEEFEEDIADMYTTGEGDAGRAYTDGESITLEIYDERR